METIFLRWSSVFQEGWSDYSSLDDLEADWKSIRQPESYQWHLKKVIAAVVPVMSCFICWGWLLFGWLIHLYQSDGIIDQSQAVLVASCESQQNNNHHYRKFVEAEYLQIAHSNRITGIPGWHTGAAVLSVYEGERSCDNRANLCGGSRPDPAKYISS